MRMLRTMYAYEVLATETDMSEQTCRLLWKKMMDMQLEENVEQYRMKQEREVVRTLDRMKKA